MINEIEFRRAVVAVAEANGGHVSHIESHLSSAGIPDLNIFMDGTDLWVELKVIKKGQVKMRPTQRRWHNDRHKTDGESWVAVLDPEKQDILILRGHTAAALPPDAKAWRAAGRAWNALAIGHLLQAITRRNGNGI